MVRLSLEDALASLPFNTPLGLPVCPLPGRDTINPWVSWLRRTVRRTLRTSHFRRGRTVARVLCAVVLLGFLSSAQAGDIVVSNVSELAGAIQAAASGDTLWLEDGLYALTSFLYVTTDGITVRSLSGDRDLVVIQGQGMSGSVPHGFLVSGHYFTVRDLSIGSVANHSVQLQPDTDFVHLSNLRIFDTGEQMVKAAYDSGDLERVSEGGVVEGCRFEYTAGVGPQYYIGGIDVHNGKNWIVRDNVFIGIRSPEQQLAEHAVHFWSGSEGTLVERNVIINCDRGIGFGLGVQGHLGGVIRNNMIYHDDSEGFADVGIGLESAPGAQVYHNTIYMEHSYPAAIEYRFASTVDVLIANNLLNRSVWQRDGASATVTHNITDAVGEWFVEPASGDLHLATGVPAVVDRALAIPECDEDVDREPRPWGKASDIGADEAVGDATRGAVMWKVY